MLRMLIALLSLPLLVIVLACGYAAVSAPAGGGLAAVSDLRFQALWYALFAYTASIVLALPALLVAWWKGWLSWWHATLFGGIIGTLVLIPAFLPTLLDDRLHLHNRLSQLWSLRELTLVGAMHGLLFWLLALWRNRAAHERRATKRLPSYERSSAA